MSEDTVKSTLDGLLKVIQTDNVIGDPIESNGKTLIPITRIGLGYASAQGQGNSARSGQGTGAGGGAAVEPIAFVVID
ncbi:MAG TPA: spore germination protein GerW family protein, partial [Methanobacterium sp.]|nr:spore germination protein GerW family protein [Methanobacterium sp.]